MSEEAFYTPSKELPLFVKVPQKMIPDDAYLYELAKETVVRYAVIHKSYLSGFLFGIHIYEMSPNHLVPNLIYKENESLILNRP